MANITNIPAPRVDFIDQRTGLMAREWYRFFLNLFQLTGGGTNSVSIEDLLMAPAPVSNIAQENIFAVEAQIAQAVSNYAELLDKIQSLQLTPAQNAPLVSADDLTPAFTLGTISYQNADNLVLGGGAVLLSTANALTNAAAAAAGTLLNGPVAGNPTKWFAINDGGTIRYIPAW